jgi:hypothetical protein
VEHVALLLHLLGALLFVSGIPLAGVAFEGARQRERPEEVALLLGLTQSGVLLVARGGLLPPIFGLWLVHLEPGCQSRVAFVSSVAVGSLRSTMRLWVRRY